MGHTSHVGHQISDADSLNRSSEESLLHSKPQLLLLFCNVIYLSLSLPSFETVSGQ